MRPTPCSPRGNWGLGEINKGKKVQGLSRRNDTERQAEQPILLGKQQGDYPRRTLQHLPERLLLACLLELCPALSLTLENGSGRDE